jgi:hypothetical protein
MAGSTRKISMEDGRLVISTAKSTRFITIFAVVFVAGLVIWMTAGVMSQELAKPGPHGRGILPVAIIVFWLLYWVVRKRANLPKMFRTVAQGEVIVFDRKKDALLRNDDLLAPLSRVKMVRTDAQVQYASSIRGLSAGYSPRVFILAEGGEVLLRVDTTSTGEARKIAEAIAAYTGAQISEV